jgi:hypothetical protein
MEWAQGPAHSCHDGTCRQAFLLVARICRNIWTFVIPLRKSGASEPHKAYHSHLIHFGSKTHLEGHS